MSNLVNLVNAKLGSKFDRFKPKKDIRVQSPINVPVRLMFQNDVGVCSIFEEMVFDPSLGHHTFVYIL